MQQSSTGKFHLEPPSAFTSLDHLVGDGEQPWAEAESQKSIETVSQTERCNITGGELAAALAHRT
jgi:hypothetical protein